MTLFDELKRRRVFRVAMVYGITAWIITEVSATVLPALRLSEELVTVIVVLLIAGFPIAMVLAWIFDINHGGISRTEATEEPGSSRLIYGGLLVLTTFVLAGFFYWRLPSTEPATRNSIAVLPFTNLSSNSESDYFSDGMSEELLNLLAKTPGLNVAARTSSFAFRDRDVDIRTIARDLGVATVLEGSVRWSEDGDRVRITAQLIDAEDGYHLWSDTYDRELQDIFALQDEIAKAIVQNLQIQLATDDKTAVVTAAVPPTRDTQAYTDYLEGRSLWRQRGAAELRRSIDLFQSAIGRDPGFARAHSNLAAAYVVLPAYAGVPRDEAYALASEAAMQAITIDPNLAEAYAVLAQVSAGEWDWKVAEANFFFATSLDASEPISHYWYSQHLARVGRGADALAEARIATDLDPGSAVMQAGLAYILDQTGDREGAVAAAERAGSLGFMGGAEILIAELHMRGGDYSKAYEVLKAAPGAHAEKLRQFEVTAAAAQNRGAAGEAAMDTAHMGPEQRVHAMIRAGADLDAVLQVVQTLAQSRMLPLEGMWGEAGRSLREAPQFVELLRGTGLMDYWRRYGWPDVCGEEVPAALCG